MPCRHRVCRLCIEGWEDSCPGEQLTCPLCRAQGQIGECSSFINDVLENLRKKCIYHQQGCPVTAPTREIAGHQRDCGYELLDCNNGCGEIYFRRDMPAHLLQCARRVHPLLLSISCFHCRWSLQNGGRPTHCDYEDLVRRVIRGQLLPIPRQD